MAVKFENATRGSLYKFPPEAIKIHPELNGRHELPDIEWLILDMAKNGQNTPVRIRAEGPPSKRIPVLTEGFSRWRAAMEIKKRKLTPEPFELACVYFDGNEVDGFVSNIRENRFRNSTTALDDAYNVARLRQWNIEDERIAAIYFPAVNGDADALKKAISWVRKTVKLVGLAPEAQQAVKDGRVKPSAAVHIAEMAAEAQKTLVAKEGNITSGDVARASGKPEKITLKSVREELDGIIADWATKLPREVADLLEKLRDKI
jgi:hypothetical protein